MDDENFDVYEEIRGTASKNWMRGASVSLQQLDQVKSTKYNLGLSDPKSLKAVGKNAAIYKAQNGGQSELETLETSPPMSNLATQQNAWGSNASIPNLIKNQTERQRLPKPTRPTRPESAKVKRQTRPPSGKRLRPQSAKESVFICDSEEVKNEPKLYIGVNGTRYDFNDRLSDNLSVQSSVSSAWISHPAAVSRANKAIGSTIRNYITGSGLSTPQTVDFDSENEGPPPPPRGSPDFMQIMESENQSLQQNDMGDMVSDLIDAGSPRSPVKPHLPTPEPISVNLHVPNVEDDYDSETEFNRVHIRKSKNKHTKGTTDIDSTMPRDAGQSSDAHSSVEQEMPSHTGPRKVEISFVDGYSGDPETLVGMDDIGQDVRKDFTINEDENEIFTITPREKKRPQSGKHYSRPQSGKSSLRHVKSRTDSGMDNFYSHAAYEATKHIKPKTQKKPVSTVTVNFLDDEEGGDKKDQTKPWKPDINNMMTNMNISETGGDDDNIDERPGSRPGSAAKQVSRIPFNYYEFGMKVKPGKGPFHKEEEKPKTITTKTITLLGDNDRTVQEFKTVSVLDQNKTTKPKEYVAPRPMSAKKPKPPPDAPEKEKKRARNYDNIETQMERVNAGNVGEVFSQTSGGDGDGIGLKPGTIPNPASNPRRYNRPSSAFSSRPSSVVSASQRNRPKSGVSNRLEPQEPDSKPRDRPVETDSVESENVRPGSRIGYNTENLDSIEGQTVNPGMLKKRRVGSAPPSRLHGTGIHTPEPRFNLIRNRPLSAQQVHAKKTEGSHCSHSRAHDPVKALHERSRTQRYPSQSQRATMSKKSRAPPDEIIEIWTRREDFTMETEGVKECRAMQDKLIDAGVPVSLETLTRGLLPPTEYGYTKPAVKTDMSPSLPPNYSSGLISKPELWLADEYKKLREAEKKVRIATAQLLAQEREEKKRAESASSSASGKKKVKGKRKGKSKKTKSKSSKDH